MKTLIDVYNHHAATHLAALARATGWRKAADACPNAVRADRYRAAGQLAAVEASQHLDAANAIQPFLPTPPTAMAQLTAFEQARLDLARAQSAILEARLDLHAA